MATDIEEIKKMLRDHEKRIVKLESVHSVSGSTRKQPSKGHKSKGDLLLSLKNEGFFGEPRRLSEIVARLAEKNYRVKYGELTVPLARMVRDGDLERKKINKKWAYLAGN